MKKLAAFGFLLTALVACAQITISSELTQTASPQKIIQGTITPAIASGSTNGEKILVTTQRNFYLINPDGTEPLLLYSGEDAPLEMASLSHDKAKFAYFKDNFIYILDIESKTTTVLNKEAIGSIGGSLRWSPDGRMLAMTCSNLQPSSSAICVIDLQDSQIDPLFNQNDADQFCSRNYMEFLDWSKDGTTMVYACFIVPEKGQKQIFAIYLYDFASKASKQIFESSSQNAIWYLHSVSLSPQKKYILVSGADQTAIDQVFLFDMSTNELKQLTSGIEHDSTAFTWRSDGESFYLHKTLATSPYPESNFVMATTGEILFSIKIDGTIIQ